MNTKSTPQARRFGLSTDELSQWNKNGYLVRFDVFTAEENDALRQVAEDIVARKRPFPSAHIDQNALVRDRKAEKAGIYAMHKIHHPSCYCPEFLARVRDPRLTDPLVDLLGPASASTICLSGRHPRLASASRGIKTSSTSAVGLRQRRLSGHGRLLTRQTGGTAVSMSSPAATNGIFFSTMTWRAHNKTSSSWRVVSATKTALQ